MRVRDLLARELVAVDADAPLHTIADKMRAQDVGMIPILSAGKAVGVVTDRDLVLRVLAPISEPSIMTAWDVMSRDPICIDEEATLERAAEVMQERRVRRLIVIGHDGTPKGVVSLSDLSRYSEKALEVMRLLSIKPHNIRYPEKPIGARRI
ncbi:MAG TPA: CBS domain-containing protein [Fimbriimonadaceae bacterium]|nr:CBS domain-containing protein [Fimbriimonadaceae bacterium]